MTSDSGGTTRFMPVVEGTSNAADILEYVYRALQAKGYDPVTQIVGYLISGDPTYITSHNGARSMITRLERDEIVEELVRVYLRGLDQ
ncbi:MAG TPA: IreB family regulatory phosphoprotein [Candidatus Limiplasma sp.]|nr:IreB family regulatory phosphoprotein [Candidatus Limiplasma sp.]